MTIFANGFLGPNTAEREWVVFEDRVYTLCFKHKLCNSVSELWVKEFEVGKLNLHLSEVSHFKK